MMACHIFKPIYFRKSCCINKFGPCRYYSNVGINECYKILGLKNGSDQESVRSAYIAAAKKYHPDSGSSEASADKFAEVETAFRTLLKHFARERCNVNECEGEFGLYYQEKESETPNETVEQAKFFDLEHTAPQHRQYLSYEGKGMGTPAARQKQYQSYRASKAVQNVSEYRFNKLNAENVTSLVEKSDKRRIKDVMTGLGLERIAEDMIQESMAKGEFDNLSGYGKPLTNLNDNPYVDFVTYKMNKVLIDNGFTPAWITMQKEIKERTESVIGLLEKDRACLGKLPLTPEETEFWKYTIEEAKKLVEILNSKIDTFNLIVPILNRQMLRFDLNKEADKVLNEGQVCSDDQRKLLNRKKPLNPDVLQIQDKSAPSFIEFLFAHKW